MKKIIVGDIVSRAWDLAVKHWPVFILLTVISYAVSSLMGGNAEAFMYLGQNPDPSEVAEALSSAINPGGAILSLLISCYLAIVMWRMLTRTVRVGEPYEKGRLADTLKVDLARYGLFLGVEVVLSMALVFGWTLCLIPGLILTIRWWFTPLIAATEDVTFTEAFRRSWQLTKGHFWELFLLGLTAIGIAIVGFCACFVGVLFAEVIIYFMVVLAYMELSSPSYGEEVVS